mmetsp:Transcript_52993/g.141048  ORF Transcript_52993/g.141048 Transcript_52993/m.141048 type:complete len:272 (-) Transcript_52993:2-817(-)
MSWLSSPAGSSRVSILSYITCTLSSGCRAEMVAKPRESLTRAPSAHAYASQGLAIRDMTCSLPLAVNMTCSTIVASPTPASDECHGSHILSSSSRSTNVSALSVALRRRPTTCRLNATMSEASSEAGTLSASPSCCHRGQPLQLNRSVIPAEPAQSCRRAPSPLAGRCTAPSLAGRLLGAGGECRPECASSWPPRVPVRLRSKKRRMAEMPCLVCSMLGLSSGLRAMLSLRLSDKSQKDTGNSTSLFSESSRLMSERSPPKLDGSARNRFL